MEVLKVVRVIYTAHEVDSRRNATLCNARDIVMNDNETM